MTRWTLTPPSSPTGSSGLHVTGPGWRHSPMIHAGIHPEMMIRWRVRFDGEVSSQDIEVLSDVGDALMEALIDAGAEDPCVSADPGRVSIEATVQGRTRSEALAKGMVVIDGALAAVHLESQTASAHTEELAAA